MEDHEKIAELEQRIETLSRRIDEVAERAGQRIDFNVSHKANYSRSRPFWGAIFIMVGLVWMANRMGWFYFDIPIAAAILIIVGLYFIVTSRR